MRSRSIRNLEAQFVLPDDGPRRPVGDDVRRLTEAGYPCHEQPDPYGHWVVFDGHDYMLNCSVEDGAAVFATLEMSWLDPPEVVEGIRRILAEAGRDTEPDESE